MNKIRILAGLSWAQKLFLALIFISPFPLGSNRPMAWLAELGLILVLLLASRSRISSALALGKRLGGRSAWWLIFSVAAWFLLLLLQAVPLEFHVWTALNRADTQYLDIVFGSGFSGNAPIAFDLSSLIDEYLKSLLYVGVLVLAFGYGSSEKFRAALYSVVLASVLANLAYAAVRVLFVAQGEDGAQWTGGFANYNHFALHLVLGFMLWLGRKAISNRRVDAQPLHSSPMHHCAVGLVLLIAIPVAGSRGALLALVAGGTAAMLLMRQGGVTFGLKVRRSTIGLTVAVLSVVAMLGAVGEKLAKMDFSEIHRIQIWRSAWEMVEQFPFFGIGGGAFQWVFPYFKSDDLIDKTYVYAHNEYLHFLIEYGITGVLIAVSFVAGLLLWMTRARAMSLISAREYSLFWLLSIPLAIHSLVDFPMHIPALAMLWMSVLGVILGSSSKRHKAQR